MIRGLNERLQMIDGKLHFRINTFSKPLLLEKKHVLQYVTDIYYDDVFEQNVYTMFMEIINPQTGLQEVHYLLNQAIDKHHNEIINYVWTNFAYGTTAGARHNKKGLVK